MMRFGFSRSLKYRVRDESIFAQVVKATFGKRRKTIRNGLKSMSLPDFDLEAVNFDLNLRPEDLSVADFVTLANLIGVPSKHSPEGSLS
jgi:16S rRNA (adenine1518-N6/adenine1519-N6)-dimethyltransferase